MSQNTDGFLETIKSGYSFKGPAIVVGGAMLGGSVVPQALIRAPLKTFNRHGLIAGATGTGKTKTMQGIAESLSLAGVPSLLMDIKGDLSGLAQPGAANSKIDERHQKIGIPWDPKNFPIEFLTISNEKGLRMRATVLEFGPVLFSKILELNDTQRGIVALIFKYCDDNALPLLDLKDFKKVLQYLTTDGKAEIEREYGRISTASTGAIMRRVIEIEQQDADQFFGERSFEVNDLLRCNAEGLGYMHVLRVTDIQDKPKLFSTFMLSLLAEIYATFPEEGDPEKPKLVVFIDEAHLIFKNASSALLSQLDSIIKLIRSKGVGIFFVTQVPGDIPENILGQLGMKVQHAFRAFTARDRKALRLVAENYPITEFYDTKELLTRLGIGEAIVTVLNEKGIPTPLAHTMLCAPRSRMDILNDAEIDAVVRSSALVSKYNERIDRESAYEILNAKLQQMDDRGEVVNKPAGRRNRSESVLGKAANSTAGRQILRTVARELTRGLLGAFGVRSGRR